MDQRLLLRLATHYGKLFAGYLLATFLIFYCTDTLRSFWIDCFSRFCSLTIIQLLFNWKSNEYPFREAPQPVPNRGGLWNILILILNLDFNLDFNSEIFFGCV